MGGTKTTTQSSNKIDPAEMALYQQNYQSAQGVANQPYQIYSGQMVAPINSTESQAGGLLGNIAANNPGSTATNAAITGAQGILGTGAPTIDPSLLSGTDLSPYLNPYQSDVINTTLQGIDQQRKMAQTADNQAATAAGAFGGSRSGVANALTNSQYDQNTAATLAQLNSSNYSQAQQAALSDVAAQNAAKTNNASNALTANGQSLTASGILGTLGQDQFNNATTAAQNLGQYGVLQQQTSQNANDAAYQEFLRQIGYPAQQQQIRNAALGLLPLQQTQTQTQTSNPSLLGSIGGILGGIGSIAQAIPFSDERLKEDIRTIGFDADGRRTVSYRYKWDEPGVTRIGYIAQELKRTDPDAVVEDDPSGFLKVDYSKVAA